MKRRMTKADEALAEYLRRNTLHCAAVGASNCFQATLDRLAATKRPPKWLVKLMKAGLERANRVAKEMAAHRNEIDPQNGAK